MTMPDGFMCWNGVLDASEQERLVSSFAFVPFTPYEFRGYKGKRQTAAYGHRYNQGRRVLEPAPPLPDFLLPLRARVAELAQCDPSLLVHALVTEYTPGAAISWHRDRLLWDVVLGVCLLSPCVLRFRRKSGDTWDRAAQRLDAGAAYLLAGEVRTLYEHSILPTAALRYSVTFRSLASPK